MSNTVNTWSRFLGVSLRPWSGDSPISLILRGAITAAICIFFAVLAVRFIGEYLAEPALAGGGAQYSWVGTVIVIGLLVFAGVGVLRIVVGALDAVPRRKVTGTVISVADRKVGDFLPRPAQRLIYERTRNGQYTNDKRRWRTELVLSTADGHRQWTVRNHKLRAQLREGSIVTVSVTPIAGYVAGIENH